MNSSAREEFFARLQAANPQPRTELEYGSNFQLLIAVMLSAQSTDVAVNRATRPLFAQHPDAASVLALGVDGLIPYVRSLGLFRSKSEHVIATCALLLERHDGAVPESREALESLPGVGRKTANVVLNTAFGWPTMAVDTHIFRVANRTGLAPGRHVRAVEEGLLAAVPAAYLQNAHHWLILHGRYTCTARRPRCQQCLVADLCAAKDLQAAALA